MWLFLVSAGALGLLSYGFAYSISGSAYLSAESLGKRLLTGPLQERGEQLARSAVVWAPGYGCRQRLLLSDVLYAQYEEGQMSSGAAKLQESLQSLRRLVAGCPASSSAWAGLIRGKQTLLQLDDEWRDAMRHGQMAGPWQLPVNRVISYFGVIAWERLRAEDRMVVLQAARMVMGYSSKEARNLQGFFYSVAPWKKICAEHGDQGICRKEQRKGRF